MNDEISKYITAFNNNRQYHDEYILYKNNLIVGIIKKISLYKKGSKNYITFSIVGKFCKQKYIYDRYDINDTNTLSLYKGCLARPDLEIVQYKRRKEPVYNKIEENELKEILLFLRRYTFCDIDLQLNSTDKNTKQIKISDISVYTYNIENVYINDPFIYRLTIAGSDNYYITRSEYDKIKEYYEECKETKTMLDIGFKLHYYNIFVEFDINVFGYVSLLNNKF